LPWSETNRMEQRAPCVLDALQGHFSMSQLSYRYGVSRKTGYEWIARLSRCGGGRAAPIGSAHRETTQADRALVAKKVVLVCRSHPGVPAGSAHPPRELEPRGTRTSAGPVPSTIGEILKRHGLVRKRRRRLAHKGMAHGPDPAGSTEPGPDGRLQGTVPLGERQPRLPLGRRCLQPMPPGVWKGAEHVPCSVTVHRQC
jgi:hypothetical protein